MNLDELFPQTLEEIYAEPEPEYNWLVPGLLEYGDRFIITGGEGSGKSTLLRQMGIQIALGLHPFELTEIEPHRVLYIDLENMPRTIKREMQKITNTAGVAPLDNFHMIRYPRGIDLKVPDFRAYLLAVMKEIRPEFVIVGPKYKMGFEVVKEEDSKALATLLDEWRITFDFALAIEDHQPHWVNGNLASFRPERPFGSSLWMRWPEFGMCLEQSGVLRPWRGARDSERKWPEKLIRGTEWPWIADTRRCLRCDTPLAGKQELYCSQTCSNNARSAKHRAQQRSLGV